MRKNGIKIFRVKAILFLLIISFTFSFARVPPPPPATVNQNIGIPDTTFKNLTKLNCAYCHAPEKLTQQQRNEMGWTFDKPETKPGVLADRHHNKVIKGVIIPKGTQAPFGTIGEPYVCLSCHKSEWNEANMRYELSNNFKDCQNCHIHNENVTVHHLTAKAQALDCKHCHGARVDNPNDGHIIRTSRRGSLSIPRPKNGTGPNGEGACTFCHKAGVDSASGISINTNAINHHSTGIGQDGISDLSCNLCHDDQEEDEMWKFKRCQNCHGMKSLHSIQFDSNGDGQIIVGQELKYFGHVGNDPIDCQGCHGGYLALLNQNALGMMFPNVVAPEILNLSTFKIIAGEEATISISGRGFTNVTYNITMKSFITITGKDDKEIKLTPISITESSIVVKTPTNIAPGNYYLHAKKGTYESNPMSIVVIPKVFISEVSENNSILTIQGQGFGKYLDSIGTNTKISLENSKCSVESWSDTQIVAKCSTKCGSLVVDSVFGSDTYIVDCNVGIGDYERGYQAAGDVAFAEGNGDKCSGKVWNLDADLNYDTKYNQGYTDGYVVAYDVGWESSCGDDNSSYGDGYKASYDIAFAEGNGDKCSAKVWNIDANLNYDTKYNQGYTDGYVVAYDVGWESSCQGDNNGSYEDGVKAAYDAGYTEGKSDSCGGKIWNIEARLTYDTLYNDGYAFGYVKAYDEGWESCR